MERALTTLLSVFHLEPPSGYAVGGHLGITTTHSLIPLGVNQVDIADSVLPDMNEGADDEEPGCYLHVCFSPSFLPRTLSMPCTMTAIPKIIRNIAVGIANKTRSMMNQGLIPVAPYSGDQPI